MIRGRDKANHIFLSKHRTSLFFAFPREVDLHEETLLEAFMGETDVTSHEWEDLWTNISVLHSRVIM